jgi:hypothetical protein
MEHAGRGHHTPVTDLAPANVLAMDPLGSLIGDGVNRKCGSRQADSGASGHHGAGADKSEKNAHDLEPFSRLGRRCGVVYRIGIGWVGDPRRHLCATREAQTQYCYNQWTEQRRQTFLSWPISEWAKAEGLKTPPQGKIQHQFRNPLRRLITSEPCPSASPPMPPAKSWRR